MFLYCYYYLYFPSLYLFLNILTRASGDDAFYATSDSLDYLKKFTTSPTKTQRWKSIANATLGLRGILLSEDKTRGTKYKKELKNKNVLLSDKDFIKEAMTKVFNRRDAKEEKNEFESLSAFLLNSSKSLPDFFKNFNESVTTATSDININMSKLLDPNYRSILEKHLSPEENEISLDRMHHGYDVAEVTTDEDLTAEDRYPNFVPTGSTKNIGAKPNLAELRYVKHPEKDSEFSEPYKHAKTHKHNENKPGNAQNGIFNERLEMLDDKFTTVSADQKIIYDPTGSNVTLQLALFGKSFIALLHVLNTENYMPNAQVTVHDKESKKNVSISALKDLQMYEGFLNSKNSSYVCGSIVDSYFTGILMLENGTVWYVERPENNDTGGNSVSGNKTNISFQNCAHTKESCHEVMISGCERKEENKIICFEGHLDGKEKRKLKKMKNKLSNKTSSHPFSSDSLKNATCTIELVSDPSHFVNVHNQSVLDTLRELLTVTLQANRVLNQIDFDGDGKEDDFGLRIGHVAMYVSYKDERSTRNESFMDQKLNMLLKRPQNRCLSLLVLSSNLTEEEPVSITYGGSICQGSINGTRPPMNVAVVNTIGPKNRNSLLPMSLRVTETIGQMMGSLEKDCEDSSSSSADSWFSFFPNCTRESMTEILANQDSCLETHKEHHTERLKIKENTENASGCGNGILDAGEECDCGKDCLTNYSCCVPAGKKNECHFDKSKGHECEWTDACCTMSCKIIPKDWQKFCGSGDPSCGPKNAYCNGNSSTCPHHQHQSSESDGRRCGPGNLEQAGAATCKNGRCDSTVCRDVGLEDCHCAHESRRTCKVCCKEKGKGKHCLPGENFGLKSNTSNFFFRYPGLPCSTVSSEYCNSMGICTSDLSGSSRVNIFYSKLIGKGMSATALAWTVLWRVMYLRLI